MQDQAQQSMCDLFRACDQVNGSAGVSEVWLNSLSLQEANPDIERVLGDRQLVPFSARYHYLLSRI